MPSDPHFEVQTGWRCNFEGFRATKWNGIRNTDSTERTDDRDRDCILVFDAGINQHRRIVEWENGRWDLSERPILFWCNPLLVFWSSLHRSWQLGSANGHCSWLTNPGIGHLIQWKYMQPRSGIGCLDILAERDIGHAAWGKPRSSQAILRINNQYCLKSEDHRIYEPKSNVPMARTEDTPARLWMIREAVTYQ